MYLSIEFTEHTPAEIFFAMGKCSLNAFPGNKIPSLLAKSPLLPMEISILKTEGEQVGDFRS